MRFAIMKSGAKTTSLPGRKWRAIDIRCPLPQRGEEPKVYNHTPLTLAPYSGAEALVQGNIKMPRQPYEMEVKVVVEDLFGKHYLLIVKASS